MCEHEHGTEHGMHKPATARNLGTPAGRLIIRSLTSIYCTYMKDQILYFGSKYVRENSSINETIIGLLSLIITFITNYLLFSPKSHLFAIHACVSIYLCTFGVKLGKVF